LEIGELLRGRETAAPAVHVERPRLRDGALRQEERPERRARRSATRPAQEGAAPAVETPGRFHGLPPRGLAPPRRNPMPICAAEPMQTGTTPAEATSAWQQGSIAA